MGKISSRSAAAWAESAPGSVHVRDAGTWKEVKSIHVRNAGVWDEVFQYIIGFLRPDADIETSDWTATPLWSKLDDTSPDDATTEISASFAGNGTQVKDFEIALSNPSGTPTTREVVTFRVRFWLDVISFGVDTKDVKIELKQGSTVKKTINTVASTVGYVTDTSTLSQAEKDSISDWDNLRVRVEYTVKGNDIFASSTGRVTWIELEFS